MDILSISNFSNPYYMTESAGMERSQVVAETFEQVLNAATQNGDDAKLMEACVEFESYFLKTMLKEMRKTVGIEEKSNAEQIFSEMLDDEYAKKAGNTGGIGLAAFMYKQMKRENTAVAD